MIDTVAAWEMAIKNKALVAKILKSHFRWLEERGKTGAVEWADYYSAGVLGLYRAAMKYQKNKGYTFSTYAYHWIRQAISREYRMRGFKYVRVPCGVIDKMSKVKKAKKERADAWIQAYGTPDLRAARRALMDGISLNAEFTNSGGKTHSYEEPILSAPDVRGGKNIQSEDEARILIRAMRALPPRELESVLWVYGFKSANEKKTSSPCRSMGIKTESIKRMARRGVSRIRRILKSIGIDNSATGDVEAGSLS